MIGMIIIALLSIIGKVIAFDDSNLGLGLLRELAVEESVKRLLIRQRLLNDETGNKRLLFGARPVGNRLLKEAKMSRFLDVDDYEPNLLY